MHLPEFLKSYRPSAEKLIADGLVKAIEFSGTTYQIQVDDPDSQQEAWAFLQLDPKGHLKDSFCSCEEAESVSGCIHIAAAYLRVYHGYTVPLHQRFDKSLWNQICRLYADRMGYDPSLLKEKGKGQYGINSVGGKQLFHVKGKTPVAIAHLKEILRHRPKETEETSLKFSNLSQEELMMWRESRPSPQLSYELSFWSDLAKWLMLMADTGADYRITFEYSPKKVPHLIYINFPEMEISFYISEANWPLIIPSLSTVNSPLVVHDPEKEAIKSICYDKKEGSLIIEPKKQGLSKKGATGIEKLGYSLGNWFFLKDDGFYAKDQHSLLKSPVLFGKEISQTLNTHFFIVKSLLEGTRIHEHLIPAHYALDFDSEWNLHVVCYVFSPGDLTTSESRFFGDWVYLDDDGFYHLEGVLFDEVETVVPEEQVADFVQQHRAWLNRQEGFETHLRSLEAQITYTLSDENRLTFSREIAPHEDPAKNKDFGPWVYVAGEGFYSKTSPSLGLPLRLGKSLNADQIPLFIRMNRDELRMIPHFFSEKCPVVKFKLTVELTEDELIYVSPEYELLPKYQTAPIRFFEDFVYVEHEGFHELPMDTRFPERFRQSLYVEKADLALFLTYELEELKKHGAKIDPQLLKPKKIQMVAQQIEKSEKKGWYLLKLDYQTEQGEIPAGKLYSAIKRKKRFLFSPVGLFDLNDNRFDWLKQLNKNQVDVRKNTLFLSTLELIRLNVLESIEVSNSHTNEGKKSLETLKELTEFRIPSPPNLTGFKSELRPYQQIGVDWLWFLYHHTLSGLLCDDMGLGKTHQTMALIAAVINEHRQNGHGEKPKFLIVCPTSVIFHWQEKLESFFPGVSVCIFHGGKRRLTDFQQHHDILLTSYGVWRIESELLKKVAFEVAVFDEIQVAKNSHSRLHVALTDADAKVKIGLSGTPIENRIRELKALFDIVLPSYMPGERDYREFFIKPIEKEQDVERRNLLSRFIKPFVMRRRKEDVLLDLPEKIEEVSHCELLPDQEKLYREVLEQSRQRVLKELNDDKTPIPYVHIFAILSHLKQICNHPAVYLKKPEEYKAYQSGKWELFVELLNESRDSQQKVVVFSQYLFMLDIIEAYVQENGIGYASIRGSTTNRKEQVNRFNHDPNCEVFIGSLQAAGLGIDLTAASVVIHYDRWWNAAKENQATDRVHRIGQMRGVQVFKLVTKGTFEERIDQLISQKGQLMEEVVGIDDHQIIKSFSRKEIMELLEYVETIKN